MCHAQVDVKNAITIRTFEPIYELQLDEWNMCMNFNENKKNNVRIIIRATEHNVRITIKKIAQMYELQLQQ